MTFATLGSQVRTVEKALAKVPPVRMVMALPETGAFALRTVLRRHTTEPIAGLPDTRLTPALLAHVAMDEAILTLAVGPERFPHRDDYERVGAEVAEAVALFGERGWLDDPRSYHRDPEPIGEVQRRRGWANGLWHERLTWQSGYEPHVGEPGRDRWLDYEANRTAGAWMVRHDDDLPRPWVVCLHGFGMGYPFMDFPAFNASHLHRGLGCNLIGPTLALHGRRKVSRLSGDQFLGVDVVNTVHGLAQSLHDVRSVLAWLRQHEEPSAIGVYGVSLGGYTAALTAAFEPDLDAVIAGIPVSDFPAMFRAQTPDVITERYVEAGILGGPGESLHQVVSPLVIESVVPHDRRFIFAGLADRMSHPRQAHDLWRHWDEPRIEWYPGNHVGYLWSSKVSGFVDEVLQQRVVTERENLGQGERVTSDG